MSSDITSLKRTRKSGHKSGTANIIRNDFNTLVSFTLPSDGNFYIVFGQVKCQNHTGAVSSFQILNGLANNVDNFDNQSKEGKNMPLTIIASSGAEIQMRGWGLNEGEVKWEYAYVEVG